MGRVTWAVVMGSVRGEGGVCGATVEAWAADRRRVLVQTSVSVLFSRRLAVKFSGVIRDNCGVTKTFEST